MSNYQTEDKNFWNGLYLAGDMGWDLGYPSPPVVEYFKEGISKSSKILIPGAGNAYEAEYLYKQGFTNLFILDIAPKAISNFKSRFPSFPENQLLCEDFFLHKGKYDLIVEQTFFCTLHPSRRPNYLSQVDLLLKKKGKLIGLLFNDPLNQDKPPFGGNKEQYIDLFSKLFEIEKMEVAYNSIAPRANRELFFSITKRTNL